MTIPEFKSNIPPHLLATLAADERFMVEAVSKLESQGLWLGTNVVQLSAALDGLDARVAATEEEQMAAAEDRKTLADRADKIDRLWEWKLVFTGKWSILALIIVTILPVIVEVFLFYVFTKTPGKP